MTKEQKEPKSKPKKVKVKKPKREAESVDETKSLEVAPGAESYVAGEIAGSLFSKKSTQSSSTLSSLFDTKVSTVQPLYVPVVLTKTKRKLPETEDTKEKTASASHPTLEKETKKPKKELTVAEKKLANRESSLANADEDEIAKAQAKKGKKSTDDEELPLYIKRRQIKSEEKVKNKRTIFIGNLPVSCTKQMLKACFKDFGEIESMRFRSLARADASLSKKVATIQRKIHPKRKNINAYVLFKEQESATKALVRNGTEISNGFHIRVDLASKSSTHDNKKSAFVGNLPYDVEEEALRGHFSDCGDIEAIRIIRDQKTGIGKGFGYVLFQGTDAVQLALKLNNSDLMGRKIRVKRCLPGGAQSTQKDAASFKPKTQSQKPGKLKKKMSFVGETADATKSKNKKPKTKKKKMK
ncbi:RNA-binding protein 34 [Rana temporaria]|uniref:RNA-binding protein 34 n=1 Tax=Rana temporaria TaxID=8407 RepID=UPI001AAD75F0|nr:RNA-binding protein 34 [Rana temporaria]